MKPHALTVLFAAIAIGATVLYITKKPPVAPEDSQGDDARDTLVAEQQAELNKLKNRLAELELEAMNKPEPEIIEVVRNVPETEPEAAGDDPARAERRQRQEEMGKMVGEFIGNLSNMFGRAENWNSENGETMAEMWQKQANLERSRRVSREYGDLLSRFDLSLEDRQTFIDLLAKRGGGGGPWGRGGNQADREAAEQEIKGFLGDEGYAAYRDFEDTKYGRGRVDEFAKTLGTGLALNPDQKDAMVGVFGDMEEFSGSFMRDAGFGRWGRGAEETAVDMDQRLDELEARYNDVIQESAEVLDEQQLQALSAHLDNNLKRAETQIEMANMWQKNLEQAMPRGEDGRNLLDMFREAAEGARNGGGN